MRLPGLLRKRLNTTPVVLAIYPDRACLWRRGAWIEKIPLEQIRRFLQMIKVPEGAGTDNGAFRQLNLVLTPLEDEWLEAIGIAHACNQSQDGKSAAGAQTGAAQPPGRGC